MRFLLAVTLFVLGACSTISKGTSKNYLSSLSSIPLGSDQAKVRQALGTPNLVENDGDATKLTYSIEYKNMQIPKVIVWLDANGRVSLKYINLFEETHDSMSLSEVKGHLGELSLQEIPKRQSGHSISPFKEIEDADAGVSIRVNESRNNEVQSISWFSPKAEGKSISDR